MNEADRRQACRLVNVSRETYDRLAAYEDALHKWRGIKNLVARSTVDHVWTRHFADSAQLAELRPDARHWVDVGSGAGFPGMVVALFLMDRPGIIVDLVESDHRKCAFLRDVARITDAPVKIHNCRAEEVMGKFDHVDVITARAVTSLESLLLLCAPLLAEGAEGLFLKGQDVARELTAAPIFSSLNLDFLPSKTDSAARIVRAKRRSGVVEPAA